MREVKHSAKCIDIEVGRVPKVRETLQIGNGECLTPQGVFGIHP